MSIGNSGRPGMTAGHPGTRYIYNIVRIVYEN
ncbi:hypothetical protein METP3_00646 [Methanosarcinales archaeon]|nr:hypothetical protein METP3_00646 [Methanosarcinales archaeon]